MMMMVSVVHRTRTLRIAAQVKMTVMMMDGDDAGGGGGIRFTGIHI
jgi:hypothetical protein